RWGEDKIDRERKYAAELVALAPDIVMASGSPSVVALQHLSSTLPIVFAAVVDPVGAGIVDFTCPALRGPYRLYDFLIQFWREMAGTSKAGRTYCRASCRPSGSQRSFGECPIRRYPECSAITRSRGKTHHGARC